MTIMWTISLTRQEVRQHNHKEQSPIKLSKHKIGKRDNQIALLKALPRH